MSTSAHLGSAATGEERKGVHTPGPLTPAMLRELNALHRTGCLTDWTEWGLTNGLWFHARDRVIGALERRGLIEATPDWTLTDAGRAAISKAGA